MKKVKDVKKWVIVHKQRPLFNTINDTKKECIDYFEAWMRASSWEYLSKNEGYSCERIEIKFLGGIANIKN